MKLQEIIDKEIGNREPYPIKNWRLYEGDIRIEHMYKYNHGIYPALVFKQSSFEYRLTQLTLLNFDAFWYITCVKKYKNLGELYSSLSELYLKL